jgi:hypothetical protein
MQGATFWDTSKFYGFGHNEKIIGEVLRENEENRKKVRFSFFSLPSDAACSRFGANRSSSSPSSATF